MKSAADWQLAQTLLNGCGTEETSCTAQEIHRDPALAFHPALARGTDQRFPSSQLGMGKGPGTVIPAHWTMGIQSSQPQYLLPLLCPEHSVLCSPSHPWKQQRLYQRTP